MTNNYKHKRFGLRSAGWMRMLLLLAVVGMGFGTAVAQTTVTIGTGTLTASGTNGTPIYRSSATSAFHHSKSIQLVTAADMAAAGVPGGAIITQWGYNKTTTAGISGANAWTMNVYLKNSSATALASGTAWNTMISGATLAYSATINSSNFPTTAGYWLWPVAGFVYAGGSVECYIEWFPAGALISPFTSAAFPWQYTATATAQAMGTSASVAIAGTNTTYTTQARVYNTRITYLPGASNDLGLQAITAPATPICSGSSTTVSVTLKNNGSATADFSVNPVTINASATGANPTTFPAVTLNSGTLAAGATQVVTIATGYNALQSGTYNFSANLSWGPDGFAGNNTFNWSANSAFNVTAASNTYTFCDGTSPQLSTTASVGYVVQSIPHAPLTPPAAPNPGPSGDDAQGSATIPFPFTFNGVAYTNLNIYTNGFVQFGTSSASTTTYGASIPTAAAPNNIIALAWEDLNVVAGVGNIQYWTDGVAPNRKFVVAFTNTAFYLNTTSTTGNVTGQIVLNEIDNSIEVFLTNIIQGGNSSVCGIENATGSSGLVAPGRQFGPWGTGTVTNEGWKFFLPTLGYAWSPSTGLSNPAIANPLATIAAGATQIYTVQVTEPASGCVVSDTVRLTNLGAGDPAPATTGASICQGQSATISATGLSTLNWYNAATGGTLVNTGSSYTFSPSTTTTLYVESFNGICPSNRTPVTVTVTPQPIVNPTATPSVLCLGATSQLAANNFVSGNLLTATLGGNGASGNAFNISNVNGNSPIRIDSVAMGIASGTLAEVWYKPGGYGCANLTSSAGWTLAGQVAITAAGGTPNLTQIPLYINVTIPVGQTYGFVVVCNGSNYYTNGSAICTPLIGDANISISQGHGGAGFGGAFSFPNSPRNFNGRVYYSFGDPNLTFNWTQSVGSGAISNNTIANPTATPSTSGTNTYQILATNTAGCTTLASVNVTANPLPDDATGLAVNNVYCGCGVANLSAVLTTAGSNVRWYTVATGGTAIGTGTPFNAPSACGVQTYYAEAYNPITGCIQSGPRQSVTVTPLPEPPISITASDLILCDADPASTLTVSSANDPNYAYTWSPATGLSATSGSVVSALPPSNTTYTVTANDATTGCVASASISIGVGLTPIISGATATPANICLGSPSQLTVTAISGGGALPPAPTTYPASGATSTADEDIDGFVFGSLSNIQAAGLCATYTNYTALSAPTFTAGQVVPFTIFIGDCENSSFFASGTSVFIDFNRDGDFVDAGEQVFTTSATTNGIHTLSGNITISPTASNGFTRLRIINVEGTASPAGSTTTYGYGETEDYTIGIQGAGLGFTYNWSPATFLNNANIASPVSTPTSSQTYTVTVTDAGGCAASTTVNVNVVNPPAAPVVTGATVCGQGAANLSATGSGGTLIWLDTIAGPILNSGNTYAPVVSTTQSYYVIEDQGGSNANVGLSATAPGTTAFASSTTNFQTFNVLSPGGIIINSVDIVPNAATPLGTAIAIQLETSTGVALGAPVSTVTTTQGTPQSITLNMFVPQGTGYRLRPVSNPNLQYHQNGFVNPYTLVNQVSITGAGPGALNLYVFFYNWSVRVFDGISSGCYSSPSVVTAVVNPAPPLDITPATTPAYCNSGSVVLNATADPSYVNFNWSPATGLNATTGTSVTASPSVTTTYILTADDGVAGGCVDTASITVTVNSGPTVSIVPAPFDTLCPGASFPINATAGSSSFKQVGFGASSANNTIAVYDGNNSNVRTQILYTAAELNAAGLIGPGNITSIAFNVVNKLSTGTLNGFTISMASTVAAPPLTTSYLNGTFTTVFTGNISTVLGWNQHLFTTPFFWDGVSNVIVNICNGAPSAPAFDQVQNTPTAVAQTLQANLLGCAAATGNPILNRPNVRFTGGAVTYSWSPAGELSNGTIEDPVFTATANGTKALTLTVTDPANGCTASSTLNFEISDKPKAASVVAITDPNVCVSATVSMRAFGTTGSIQWQLSSDNINFTDVPGATDDTLSIAVSVDTYFRAKALCVDSSFSSSLLFDVSNPSLASIEADTVCGQGLVSLVAKPGAGFFSVWYDAPVNGNFIQVGDTLQQFLTVTDTFYVAGSVAPAPSALGAPTTYAASSATSAADDEIFNVTFGTINNTSTCATTGGPGSITAQYSNYTSLVAPAIVQPGNSVPFSVTIGYCNGFAYSMVFAIYIDFNRDGDFADAGETAYTNAAATAAVAGTAYTGTIAIPATASLGQTRMRVVCVEGAAAPATGTYTWGETEDYTIQIGADVCQTARVPVIGFVSPAPTLAVTPGSVTLCQGQSATLNVTSGLADFTQFDWTPSIGLSATSGTLVVANPTSNVTYTLTASGNPFGCVASVNVPVSVNANPVFTVATTTPSVCGGGTATMTATVTSPLPVFTVESIAYSPLTPPASPNAGPSGDDTELAATIPFPFTYNGVAYTNVNIYTNGFIQFGNSSFSTTAYGASIPTAAAPNNIVALAWEDLNVTTGNIQYWTDGIAPNRKFVVAYNNVFFWSASGNVTGQIVLNESDNSIEIFHTNITQAGNFAVCGIENANGTSGLVAPGRQFGTWGSGTVVNEGWRFFVPPAATIQWTGQNIVGASNTATINAIPTSSSYYTCVVTNPATGCTTIDSVLVNASANPVPNIITNDTSLCNPDFIYVKVADAGPYAGGSYPAGTNFTWNAIGVPIPDLDSISSVNGSTYFVTVTLPSGCFGKSDTVTVLTKSVAVVETITNSSCVSVDGQIVVNVTSGLPSYNFVWSTDFAQTNIIRNVTSANPSDSLENLAAGTYYLQVFDEAGQPASCNSGILTYVVGGSTPIVASVTGTNISCNGFADGSATVTYTGGTAPYNVLWSDGATTDTRAVFAGANLTVIVSDNSGCADTAAITINEPSPLGLNLSATPTTAAASSGSVSATAIGGTPTYNYDWFDAVFTPIGSGSTIGSLTSGLYYCLVTDANGCQFSDTVSVTVLTNATLNLTAIIQGYYDGVSGNVSALLNSGVGTSATECDTIVVELRDALSPSTVVASGTVVLGTNGQTSVTYPGSVVGGSYYIALFHRNAVQTWSASPVTMSATTSYDFTTAATQAFGSNLTEVAPGVWALYSGDLAPQDEVVDFFDQVVLDNDVSIFATGYAVSDLTGDGLVDFFDQVILDNNITNFVSSVHP